MGFPAARNDTHMGYSGKGLFFRCLDKSRSGRKSRAKPKGQRETGDKSANMRAVSNPSPGAGIKNGA